MPHDAPKIYGPTGDDNTGVSSLAAKAATGHYDSKRNDALGDARAQSAKDVTGDEPALERQNSETNATQVGPPPSRNRSLRELWSLGVADSFEDRD